MIRQIIIALIPVKKLWVILSIVAVFSSFCTIITDTNYTSFYTSSVNELLTQQRLLLSRINDAKDFSPAEREGLKETIESARIKLKNVDFWLRYLEPVVYKKVNGPLPVEWENEVFEKQEFPYKREGAGLTLAELYLNEKNVNKDTLARLVALSIGAMNTFQADSITAQLEKPDLFFLCNRLYLLNLAAIYTTGFDCPDTKNVIPELRSMTAGVRHIYVHYNKQFTATPLTEEYMAVYDRMLTFINSQPPDFEKFDRFTFIKNYVNPLFAMNQKLIVRYGVISTSFNDYTLSNTSSSIFDKSLYTAQNTLGIYSLVEDKETLKEIKTVGKLLFYDPILSGNNSRSCASCHKPAQYFTDTSFATSLNFDNAQRLQRNTPTLINVIYNHLLMLDGKHISLHNQAMDVMTNATEMGGSGADVLEKVLSCKEYKTTFKKLLKVTPEEKEITMSHIISAITYYYGSFSNYYSPFDEAMNHDQPLENEAVNGFNLFMGKAKCATCHYVPQFNGVPPPYVSSEFEVLGTPADTAYSRPSDDKGRYGINPAFETNGAFRTGTVRNAAHTKPYMHNGVFNSLDQVIDFYDSGGGAGKNLKIINQTLSSDPLKLTAIEKKELIRFLYSLNENIIFDAPPDTLPISSEKALNTRKVGGSY